MNEEDGIRVSYENAKEEWKFEASKALWELCRKKDFVTSEDIIDVLQKRKVDTRNLSALGGVFTRGKNNGWIKLHGIVLSQRKSRHHAPIRKWRSLIKKEGRWAR